MYSHVSSKVSTSFSRLGGHAQDWYIRIGRTQAVYSSAVDDDKLILWFNLKLHACVKDKHTSMQNTDKNVLIRVIEYHYAV